MAFSSSAFLGSSSTDRTSTTTEEYTTRTIRGSKGGNRFVTFGDYAPAAQGAETSPYSLPSHSPSPLSPAESLESLPPTTPLDGTHHHPLGLGAIPTIQGRMLEYKGYTYPSPPSTTSDPKHPVPLPSTTTTTANPTTTTSSNVTTSLLPKPTISFDDLPHDIRHDFLSPVLGAVYFGGLLDSPVLSQRSLIHHSTLNNHHFPMSGLCLSSQPPLRCPSSRRGSTFDDRSNSEGSDVRRVQPRLIEGVPEGQQQLSPTSPVLDLKHASPATTAIALSSAPPDNDDASALLSPLSPEWDASVLDSLPTDDGPIDPSIGTRRADDGMDDESILTEFTMSSGGDTLSTPSRSGSRPILPLLDIPNPSFSTLRSYAPSPSSPLWLADELELCTLPIDPSANLHESGSSSKPETEHDGDGDLHMVSPPSSGPPDTPGPQSAFLPFLELGDEDEDPSSPSARPLNIWPCSQKTEYLPPRSTVTFDGPQPCDERQQAPPSLAWDFGSVPDCQFEVSSLDQEDRDTQMNPLGGEGGGYEYAESRADRGETRTDDDTAMTDCDRTREDYDEYLEQELLKSPSIRLRGFRALPEVATALPAHAIDHHPSDHGFVELDDRPAHVSTDSVSTISTSISAPHISSPGLPPSSTSLLLDLPLLDSADDLPLSLAHQPLSQSLDADFDLSAIEPDTLKKLPLQEAEEVERLAALQARAKENERIAKGVEGGLTDVIADLRSRGGGGGALQEHGRLEGIPTKAGGTEPEDATQLQRAVVEVRAHARREREKAREVGALVTLKLRGIQAEREMTKGNREGQMLEVTDPCYHCIPQAGSPIASPSSPEDRLSTPHSQLFDSHSPLSRSAWYSPQAATSATASRKHPRMATIAQLVAKMFLNRHESGIRRPPTIFTPHTAFPSSTTNSHESLGSASRSSIASSPLSFSEFPPTSPSTTTILSSLTPPATPILASTPPSKASTYRYKHLWMKGLSAAGVHLDDPSSGSGFGLKLGPGATRQQPFAQYQRRYKFLRSSPLAKYSVVASDEDQVQKSPGEVRIYEARDDSEDDPDSVGALWDDHEDLEGGFDALRNPILWDDM